MSTSDQVPVLLKRIADLEEENRHLHETVTYLTRKLYGSSSSEKTSSLRIKGQMSLFDEAEVMEDPDAAEPRVTVTLVHDRKKKAQGQREELLKELPHVKKLCTLGEADRFCETCGNQLYSVGEEFVRSEVEYIPAKLQVIDYYRETFECRNCRKAGRPYMDKGIVPDPVLQHSYASPSSITSVIYQKYGLGVTLYRQEKEWAALGLGLSSATMANWIMAVYRDWLSPLISLLHRKLLMEDYIHSDDTPVQVMNEPGKENTSESRMWVYASRKNSCRPIRIFEYQPGRSGEYPKEFLKGFRGYLITDAYAGYEKVPDIKRALCWSHLRRYFVDALPKDVHTPEATLPAQAIRYINSLFRIEEKLSVLITAEAVKEQRLIQEIPVLDVFWTWIEKHKDDCPPESKLGKAFRYAVNQKDGLMTYLQDGNIAISNNLAENSIRPFTIGRKNWLFSGSPKGAAASAAIYTLIETAKANGINPEKYIFYILDDLPGREFLQYPEILEDYLPWNKKVKKDCQ